MSLPSPIDDKTGPRCSVKRRGRWLVVEFRDPQLALSWAIVGGGCRRVRTVAWCQVEDRELRPPVDPCRFLRRRFREDGIAEGVGLLTSRSLDSYVDVERRYGGFTVRSIATVGLGNAIRIGDPPGPSARIGTINLLCSLSVRLSENALVEALALATEARTAAVLEARVPSSVSGLTATGTGTDCIVVSAVGEGAALEYAGKHTVVGHLIGASVTEAIRRGAELWKAENAEAARR